MKKKFIFIVSMILALTMAFSLVACKDDADGGEPTNNTGGGAVAPITSVTTVEGAYEYFANLPQGDNEAEVDEILQDAFGVDLTFPTAERVSSYDGSGTIDDATYKYYTVNIDGTTLTGQEFYNSIKTAMTAAGYEGEDDSLLFGKVVGDIVCIFEITGRNGWVKINIKAYEYVAPEAPKYTLPENLKVVYEYNGLDVIAIKIGNNYYSEYSSYGNVVTMKYYSHYDETTETWTLYDWNYGDSDWGYNYFTGGSRYTTQSKTVVESQAFAYIVDYSGYGEYYNESGTVTVNGRTAKKFTHINSTTENPDEYYADVETGLILKTISTNSVCQVTEFTTNVTSFDGYSLPGDNAGGVEDNSQYTLPENVKVVFNANVGTVTAIKVGKEYYLEYTYNGTINKSYFRQESGAWKGYHTYHGEWDLSDENTTNPSSESEVQQTVFMWLTDAAVLEFDTVYYTKDTTQQTIGEWTCDVWRMNDTFTYWQDVESGLIVKCDRMGSIFTIDSFDDTITSFGNADIPTIT